MVGDYNIYVKSVVDAADKTVKAVNEPIEKFNRPTNLRTPKNAENYKKQMLAGQWKWTPVYCQFWENMYDAYDGNHRVAAAFMANDEKPGTVTHIPVRDVSNIIDTAIKNFDAGRETTIGGVKIGIRGKA
jgi:hypothetical protein